MALAEVDESAVRAAIAEFDGLGRKKFLDTYGFGTATTYLLRHGGHFYDPKAIVGVANRHTAEGRPLGPKEFDATEAIARLRRLGFQVVPFAGLWWVNQRATYVHERDGGYVWAPQWTKTGHGVAHHTNVNRLRVGERIIHYVDGDICAIGTVAQAPYTAPRPAEFKTEAWDNEGFCCPVDYRELVSKIPRDDIPDRSPEVGPFDVNGKVKQGYLFKIEADHTLWMLEFLDQRIPDLFGSIVTHPHANPPEDSVEMEQAVDPILEALLTFKNVVLEGVPGTGKTYAIEGLAKAWRARTGRELVRFGDRPYCAIVLHPSSSYEDFIEGLRPGITADGGLFDEAAASTGDFQVRDGFFLNVCKAAARAPGQDVLVLLDELNRCNVPSVFGDLLLTLEASRRAVHVPSKGGVGARVWEVATPAQLAYSGRTFFVPSNVYVVATTNTTDRSVAPLDAALRRRFAFHRIEPTMPTGEVLNASVSEEAKSLFVQSAQILRDLNDHVLRPCLGPDAMLGQSYLHAVADVLNREPGIEAAIQQLRLQWRYTILPQLIDIVRALGAEDMLDAGMRNDWFAEHTELQAEQHKNAMPALKGLDSFLRDALELQLIVDGTGLARGARIATYSGSAAAEPTPVDENEPDDDAADEE